MVVTVPPGHPRPTGAVHVLHPGGVACGDRGDRLETLLGSCVAIVLTDPRRTIGAMCHLVNATPSARADRRDARFGPAALDAMCALLRARAIEPRLCEAWVYGGGNMFPTLDAPPDVGGRNAAWALEALERSDVRVLAVDTGGAAYRRLAWTVGPDLPRVTAVPL